MSRFRAFLVLALSVIVVVAGCNRAPSSAPTLATQTAATTSSSYWPLVRKAQSAFASAEYAEAMKTAREAISVDPDENTAWEIYREASIARSADEYLQTLPDHRYRLPVDVFVRDRVNHTRDWVVVDVREPDEFAAGHIEGAINIPFRQILHHLDELPNSRTAPILLYCHSQKRATHALVILHELGYLKVYNLEGGYEAYVTWMKQNAVPTPGPTPTPGPEEPDFGC